MPSVTVQRTVDVYVLPPVLAPPNFVQFVVGELGDTAVWPLPDKNDHAYVNGPSPPLTETFTLFVDAVHPVEPVVHIPKASPLFVTVIGV